MVIEPFAPEDFQDFRVFDLPGFADRMAARWGGPDYARAARETFGARRDCVRLQ